MRKILYTNRQPINLCHHAILIITIFWIIYKIVIKSKSYHLQNGIVAIRTVFVLQNTHWHSCVLSSDKVYLWGGYRNTYVVYDKDGNADTCSFDVFVRSKYQTYTICTCLYVSMWVFTWEKKYIVADTVLILCTERKQLKPLLKIIIVNLAMVHLSMMYFVNSECEMCVV